MDEEVGEDANDVPPSTKQQKIWQLLSFASKWLLLLILVFKTATSKLFTGRHIVMNLHTPSISNFNKTPLEAVAV